MNILHCADVHLDSKIEANLSLEKAKERKREILITFSKMVDYAEKNDVRAIMIAGDLFDTNGASRKTMEYVMDIVNAHPAIDFIYLKGNHDNSCLERFQTKEAEYSNLKTFGSEWTSYRYGNVVISGIEAECIDASVCSGIVLSPADRNIVMLHGQIGSSSGDGIININLLRNKNIDYLALGHIHSYREGELDAGGIYCYSGCLEGRGFDECGEKGFVFISENEGRLYHKFVPFAGRKLHTIDVDISDCTALRETESRVMQALSGISRDDLVKVQLVGTYSVDTGKDILHLTKLLNSEFYYAKVYDLTRLLIDIEEYKNDVSLKGEFIRLVLSGDEDALTKERIISCGLRALSGEDVLE